MTTSSTTSSSTTTSSTTSSSTTTSSTNIDLDNNELHDDCIYINNNNILHYQQLHHDSLIQHLTIFVIDYKHFFHKLNYLVNHFFILHALFHQRYRVHSYPHRAAPFG